MPAARVSGDDLRAVKRRLKDRFTALSADRGKDGMHEFLPDGRTLRWQVRELRGMLAAVNSERRELGKPPVDEQAIRLAEQQACGHADYADKWPWYCAEIVYGVFPLAREQ